MYAKVIIAASSEKTDKPYDYEIPPDMPLCAGQTVSVPFGNSPRKGYVVEISEKTDVPSEKIKRVAAVFGNTPAFNENTLALAAFMSEKYFTPLAKCVETAWPFAANGFKNKAKEFENFTEASAADFLPTLTAQQEAACFFLRKKTEEKNLRPTLVYGVTGSGKTEIYMRLIEYVLSQGKQAIMLVPEISLTPQTAMWFKERFGESVGVTHSKLTLSARRALWQAALAGRLNVMVGPRSALFTPFTRLGLIIIDEEHENSYKSEQSPKYSAKEVALFMNARFGVHLVLGSATPSLESFYEAKNGEYDLITLSERINRVMPRVYICDMRRELAGGNTGMFSRELSAAVTDTLEKNEQIILFLNRRGHSTFVSCFACGYCLECDDCRVNYTYHKYNGLLMCHYCGKRVITPKVCPCCGSKHIKYFGAGTQKIEEEIKKIAPNAAVLRMDADTTAKRGAHEKILKAFFLREADILIGTQMIAKGLDYPSVTLVGVICADMSLNLGDFRSGEHTFRILTQVAGRAGRADKTGRVFIQTYNPGHYSITFAKDHDYEGFYAYETAARKVLSYPPFEKLFLIMFIGADEKSVIKLLFTLSEIMRAYDRKRMFSQIGPAPAVISKIKNSYRWKLIVKCADEEKLRVFSLFCLKKLESKHGLKGVTVNLTPNPVHIP